jgi:adenosine deaminase
MSTTLAQCHNASSPNSQTDIRGKVPSAPDELARFFVFDDFAHFIRNYLLVVDLIKTAEDVRLITYEVAADMADQNIRYAELTVTPYISVSDDLPAEAFLEAIEDARQAASRDHGLELRWIFDIPADFGLPAAELTASVALDHDVPGLVGFGLGGAERGFPRSMFRDQQRPRPPSVPRSAVMRLRRLLDWRHSLSTRCLRRRAARWRHLSGLRTRPGIGW